MATHAWTSSAINLDGLDQDHTLVLAAFSGELRATARRSPADPKEHLTFTLEKKGVDPYIIFKKEGANEDYSENIPVHVFRTLLGHEESVSLKLRLVSSFGQSAELEFTVVER